MSEHKINAKGKIMGRIASEAALFLMGKNLPSYKPNAVSGARVKIYNTDLIRYSGKKSSQKIYYRHSGRIGNLKAETLGHMIQRDSRQAIKLAIFGMLPKNRLRQLRMKNLFLFTGEMREVVE